MSDLDNPVCREICAWWRGYLGWAEQEHGPDTGWSAPMEEIVKSCNIHVRKNLPEHPFILAGRWLQWDALQFGFFGEVHRDRPYFPRSTYNDSIHRWVFPSVAACRIALTRAELEAGFRAALTRAELEAGFIVGPAPKSAPEPDNYEMCDKCRAYLRRKKAHQQSRKLRGQMVVELIERLRTHACTEPEKRCDLCRLVSLFGQK